MSISSHPSLLRAGRLILRAAACSLLASSALAFAQSLPIDAKRFEPALPKALTGYQARKAEFENTTGPFKQAKASIAFTDPRGGSQPPIVVRFSSESENMVRMYKSTATYLSSDINTASEKTLMWGKRRALGTEVGPEQWQIETLVADRYRASVICPLGLERCIKLVQQIDLDKLEAVK